MKNTITPTAPGEKFHIGLKVFDLSDTEGTVIESPLYPHKIRVSFDGKGGNWRDLNPHQLRIKKEGDNYIMMPEKRHNDIVEALKLFLDTCDDLGGNCPVAFRNAKDKAKEALYNSTGEEQYKPHYLK